MMEAEQVDPPRKAAGALRIPVGVGFDDLRVRWDSGSHQLTYDARRFSDVLMASGINPRELDQDQARALLRDWYVRHLRSGGRPNAAMDFWVALLDVQARPDIQLLQPHPTTN